MYVRNDSRMLNMRKIMRISLPAGLAVCLVAVAVIGAPGAEPPEQGSNFRNIQVLTMLTDREIQQTMQRWTEQFSVTCFECHVQGDFASDDMERKRIARQMAGMVLALDQTPFFEESGWTADCYMCHKGAFETEMAP
jgi:hypothetical protein